MGTNGTSFVAALDVGTTTLRCQIVNSAAETLSTASVQVSECVSVTLSSRGSAVTTRSLEILRAVETATRCVQHVDGYFTVVSGFCLPFFGGKGDGTEVGSNPSSPNFC